MKMMETILEANLMDRIEMSYNLICFLLGVPINLITLRWLLGRERGSSSVLHVHLNISDLLVLFCYCFARFCWLVTYEWKAGQMMCKTMRFAESLSFSVSSYIVVCIAVNRFCTLRHPLKSAVNWEQRVRTLSCSAWLFAVLFSVPQLFVWDVYTLDDNYTQCLNIWVKETVDTMLNDAESGVNATAGNPEHWDDAVRLYEMYHLLVIFWIPLLILICFYALIIHEMYVTMALCDNKQLSRQSSSSAQNRFSLRRSSKSTQIMKRNRWCALRSTLILMTAYTLCWLPYNSLALWGVIDPESYMEHENTVYIMHGLVVLNSVINPCIYGGAFRRALRSQRKGTKIYKSIALEQNA
ncbi:unnamed protein product [Anisakis simplex]|uniref:G_PROTEIN_RECEP_F1_2 domain-containing protein n=1 Tax=Anisakis simplex TaxID=6269 RepID=A0A0M3JVZ8_ANISI|nr:unnamed protein product [Anisakis simplex]